MLVLFAGSWPGVGVVLFVFVLFCFYFVVVLMYLLVFCAFVVGMFDGMMVVCLRWYWFVLGYALFVWCRALWIGC